MPEGFEYLVRRIEEMAQEAERRTLRLEQIIEVEQRRAADAESDVRKMRAQFDADRTKSVERLSRLGELHKAARAVADIPRDLRHLFDSVTAMDRLRAALVAAAHDCGQPIGAER